MAISDGDTLAPRVIPLWRHAHGGDAGAAVVAEPDVGVFEAAAAAVGDVELHQPTADVLSVSDRVPAELLHDAFAHPTAEPRAGRLALALRAAPDLCRRIREATKAAAWSVRPRVRLARAEAPAPAPSRLLRRD